MRILVISDSHGDDDVILKVIALESPEMILHLGDHDKDCSGVELEYPDIPLRSVRGNCDRSSANLDLDEFTLGGKRFFMTHGHLFRVKAGYFSIINFAVSRGIDVLLFGHTHIPYHAVINHMSIINPGSIGMSGKTYAILDNKDGEVVCEIKKVAL